MLCKDLLYLILRYKSNHMEISTIDDFINLTPQYTSVRLYNPYLIDEMVENYLWVKTVEMVFEH